MKVLKSNLTTLDVIQYTSIYTYNTLSRLKLTINQPKLVAELLDENNLVLIEIDEDVKIYLINQFSNFFN